MFTVSRNQHLSIRYILVGAIITYMLVVIVSNAGVNAACEPLPHGNPICKRQAEMPHLVAHLHLLPRKSTFVSLRRVSKLVVLYLL
jgi:hypothetical protein